MKKAKAAGTKLNFKYPVDTVGSRLARQIRRECNSLTPKERKTLLREGLKRINQGVQK